MAMTTIEWRYSDGKIELCEEPRNIETARVFVTFVEDETDQAKKSRSEKKP